jgi:2,3,4,5-tetrahydropyridine-2,6-dicarboxylate N-succinyltransferase
MNHDALKSVIDAAWEIRDQLTQQTMGEIRDAVNTEEGGFVVLPTRSIRSSPAGAKTSGRRRLSRRAERGGAPSAYIAPGVVLMPSFVNLGAYVDEGTMVDTWATVGSCAQIGKNVHLSGGVGIGGVLEPMQAGPTIIEDNCFIGARSEVVEGCIVREGAVLGMGVFIGKSTKIVDRETGEVMYGEVPPYSVVVPARCRRRTTSVSIAP